MPLSGEGALPENGAIPATLDGLVRLVMGKWGWHGVSPAQRQLLAEIADHHAPGSDGVRRVAAKLMATNARDPVAYLRQVDRELKEQGRKVSEDQERESGRWRATDRRVATDRMVRVADVLAAQR